MRACEFGIVKLLAADESVDLVPGFYVEKILECATLAVLCSFGKLVDFQLVDESPIGEE